MIVLTEALRNAIQEDAETTYPNECCGILIGEIAEKTPAAIGNEFAGKSPSAMGNEFVKKSPAVMGNEFAGKPPAASDGDITEKSPVSQDSEIREIRQIYRVENHFQEGEQYHRFSIDAKDYMRAEREAGKLGLSVLGVYHSHPDHPSEPSEYDRQMAWPFYSYVILSVQKGRSHKLTSWRLKKDGSAFDEEAIALNSGDTKV